MRKLFFSGSGCHARLDAPPSGGSGGPPPAAGQACETVHVSDTPQAPPDLREVAAAREPVATDREVARLTGGGP
jgi:hypothetical protein